MLNPTIIIAVIILWMKKCNILILALRLATKYYCTDEPQKAEAVILSSVSQLYDLKRSSKKQKKNNAIWG